MDTILVIDDDSAVQEVLRRTFVSSGFQVATATDRMTAISIFDSKLPCAVILEPRIPGAAGQDLCREIRRRSPRVPILVLSAENAEVDKVLLLELGADDYVTKPFSPRELLARVRSAVRRLNQEEQSDDNTFRFGEVEVNFLSMEVTRHGSAVQLTPQEFKMLRFLVQNQGRVISSHELLQAAWEKPIEPGSRTIATHILRLRQKLEKNPASPIHFRTVHGAGYKFLK